MLLITQLITLTNMNPIVANMAAVLLVLIVVTSLVAIQQTGKNKVDKIDENASAPDLDNDVK